MTNVAMKPVAILGGGGHGRVVLAVLRAMSREVPGVIDPKESTALSADLRWIGADLRSIDPADCELALGVGSIDAGKRNARPRLFDEGKAAGFTFTSLRHPSAIVASDVKIGEGAQIMAGSVIQTGTLLGRNVIVNTSASVDHDCRIADHVHIAPGVVLSGGVIVEEGVHLGTGSIVIQAIRIGAGAMIAAGVIVTETVSAGARLRAQR